MKITIEGTSEDITKMLQAIQTGLEHAGKIDGKKLAAALSASLLNGVNTRGLG